MLVVALIGVLLIGGLVVLGGAVLASGLNTRYYEEL